MSQRRILTTPSKYIQGPGVMDDLGELVKSMGNTFVFLAEDFIFDLKKDAIYMFGITALTGYVTDYSTSFWILLLVELVIATIGSTATLTWVGIVFSGEMCYTWGSKLTDKWEFAKRRNRGGLLMKNVLLSADSEISVFSVPDKIADNLEKYCLEFCCHWLHESPDAAKYRVKMGDVVGACYSEKDYLNQYICEEQSVLIATLADVFGEDGLPEEYIGLPYFNF